MPKTIKHPIVTWGSILTGVGLIVLGLHVMATDLAATGYGVSPLDANGKAYLLAAGARDLALGITTLYLLKNHRSALAAYFLCMLTIPIADTMIVLGYGDAIWKIWPHAIGAVGIAVIAIFAFRENRTKGE